MQRYILSPAQESIARLLLEGLSYRQIATALHRNKEGVKHATKQIYARLSSLLAAERRDAGLELLSQFLAFRFGTPTPNRWAPTTAAEGRRLSSTRGDAGPQLSATRFPVTLAPRSPPSRHIRVNVLARELELKSHAILEFLAQLGVSKKSHSSALSDEIADRVRRHFKGEADEPFDSGRADEYVALALVDGRFQVIAILPDGTWRYLDALSGLHDLVYTVSSETRELEQAIEELEDLLNSRVVKEEDFQRFFERNPGFITADDYVEARPDVYLAREGQPTLKPDFMVKPLDPQCTSDLLELKLPSAQIYINRPHRQRLSQAVMEARAQLMEYSRYFDDATNREFIRGKYGIFAYRPRMYVVIGRRVDVSPVIRRKAELTAEDLHLLTYDDIIKRMQHRLGCMKDGPQR